MSEWDELNENIYAYSTYFGGWEFRKGVVMLVSFNFCTCHFHPPPYLAITASQIPHLLDIKTGDIVVTEEKA